MIDKIENVEVDEKQIKPFLKDIYQKLEWLDRDELIKRFVSVEFNRFLNYYKEANKLQSKEVKNQRKKEETKNQ